MKRIYPAKIQDKFFLSRMLEQLIQILETCPLQVSLKSLSYDAQIPIGIFQRLQTLHKNPADAANINAQDYHILFSNILFRYPTIQIFKLRDGNIFFKM